MEDVLSEFREVLEVTSNVVTTLFDRLDTKEW